MADHTDSQLSSILQAARYSGQSFLSLCRDLQQNHFNFQHEPELMRVMYQLNRIYPSLAAPGDRLRQLRDNVRQNLRATRGSFPIGTIIPDVWIHPKTGVPYAMPLIVVHYDKSGVFLLRQNALPVQKEYVMTTNYHYRESIIDEYLNDPNGYVGGCSAELLEVVSPVQIRDDPYGPMTTTFFLPSPSNLGIHIPNGSPTPQESVWEYFKDCTDDPNRGCAKRDFQDPMGRKRYCWLRGAGAGQCTTSDWLTQIGCAWCLAPGLGIQKVGVNKEESLIIACAIR